MTKSLYNKFYEAGGSEAEASTGEEGGARNNSINQADLG